MKLVKIFKTALIFMLAVIILYTFLILLDQNVSTEKMVFVLFFGALAECLIFRISYRKITEITMLDIEGKYFLDKFFKKKKFNFAKYFVVVVCQYFLVIFFIRFNAIMLKEFKVDLMPQLVMAFISMSIFSVVLATWLGLEKTNIVFLKKIILNTAIPIIVTMVYFYLKRAPFSGNAIVPIITIVLSNLLIGFVKIDYEKIKKEWLFLFNIPLIPYSILFVLVIIASIFVKLA
jgi:hypothetical protein